MSSFAIKRPNRPHLSCVLVFIHSHVFKGLLYSGSMYFKRILYCTIFDSVQCRVKMSFIYSDRWHLIIYSGFLEMPEELFETTLNIQ